MANSPKQHGGNILAVANELGCPVAALLDMSSNLMPLPMVAGLRETIIERLDEIAYLPETESETLRDLFAARHRRKNDEVLVGNGTTDFIFAAPNLAGLTRAVIVDPTYNDYRLACDWAGLPVSGFPLAAADDFHLDLNRLAATLAGGELVFLCNPNNPSGTITPSADLHAMIAAHPETLFLVDESYLQFTREASLLDLAPLPNLLILTSYSKIYGIPGLRLGFLTGTPARLAAISARNKPWGVNRVAQVAGEFLVTHGDAHVEAVLQYTATHRPAFVAALAALPGIEVVNGVCNFILCRLTGAMRAGALRKAMLAHRIIIRDCANFTGLDDRYFRVSLKDPVGNRRCLDALTKILTPS
ncbi:MAG: aminotransferase class I/II-fold pyridoxal phosphate-dependent enzyme [Desulfobulbaceae bacterium]|nr:aminotransferase class I/II-fold pyridoxal phosphate-dependent enzyme [Desulfobulbaceae bacterium]